MTKDVLVTVSGTQFSMGSEPIELMTTGTYYYKNNKHYVLYEEQADGNEPPVKNRVKFYDGYFEMAKRGGITSFMTFEQDHKTSNVYTTSAGAVQVDITTHEVEFEEREDEIRAKVSYTLEINYQFVSECEVDFRVQARA